MTEDQIERRAERIMDGLDRRYMGGHMSETQYKAAVDQLDTECKRLHGHATKEER